MSFPIRLSLAFISLMAPITAAAVAPGNVTGIKAALQDGRVLVTWTPVVDQPIKSYRVFFSHASILKENGLYDDYETVDGTLNSFLIPTTPPVETLYVSVLAVSTAGEESPYFAEEASVNIKSGDTSTTPSTIAPPSSGMPQDNASLQLVGAQALSATGVQLTFSQAVAVDPAHAADAFTVTSGSGKMLALTRLVIKGNTVIINTLPQERGTVYAVIINAGVSGKTPAGASIPLDPTQAPMLFAGSPDGIDPEAVAQTSGVAMQQPASGTEVSALRLRAQAEGRGLYTVNATWQIPAGVAAFQVYQTVNGGGTYSEGKSLSNTTGGVSIPHVPAGNYGLLVRAVYADGSTSRGVTQTINLPGTAPMQASVLPSNGTSTRLPNSGPGAITALLMLSSVAGYAYMKHKRTLTA